MSQSTSSMAGPASKRYRREDDDNSSESDDDYVPYVPVKERKKQQLMKLGRLGQLKDENKAKSSSENENENEDEDGQVWGRKSNISLLDQHTELKKLAEAKKESAMERQLKEEERILESVAESKALMGVAELAKGIQYEDPIKTRKTPFTRREREIVLWILRKHASILGNKKTDANTSHMKKMAWYQIGLEYNSMEEIQEQVTPKQLLKLWENMRRKYKPEIQAKLAECSEFTMEDEIDIMLSALGEGDYSNLSFNGDGSIEVILNEAATLPDEDSNAAGQLDNPLQSYSNCDKPYVPQHQSNNLDSTTGNLASYNTREQVPINQQEAYEPYITTTSNSSTTVKSRKLPSKATHQPSGAAELRLNPARDELYHLRIEHARQEVREQTARAQEAEYRSETAKESLRAARAKANMAELELELKKQELQKQST